MRKQDSKKTPALVRVFFVEGLGLHNKPNLIEVLPRGVTRLHVIFPEI
jgi:hypothetical protein